jgi:hypothetical protein
MTTITKFYLRYVSADVSQQYPPNWNISTKAEIIANTTEEAKSKLFDIIGFPSEGREWRVTVDKIEQEPSKEDYWGPLVDGFPY